MFGFSLATQLIQGSTERTWNCVTHFAHLLWSKLGHIKQTTMPRSRKRHHSRSRSRSRSESHDRSREDKQKKNDSHEKDRDGKRRKIESYDSPHQKRSVSSERENSKEDNQEVINVEDTVKQEASSDTLVPQNQNNEESEDAELLNSSKNSKSSSSDSDEEKMEGNNTNDETADNDVIVIDDTDAVKTETKDGHASKKLNDKLKITPKKVQSPKHLQKMLESEKKRQQKQKEREEREKQKNEEKERKLKEKMEKQEQKQKEKELKEEQKRKEKEEKEQKRKEKEEEKEQKRKEKEEKEELKRKEKEQEKLKRQQELEEKNKEKQKLEEQKQKAAAAFVNFFVPKKSEVASEERKSEEITASIFMPFQVKSDMRLPPIRRDYLKPDAKEFLTNRLNAPEETTNYLKDIKDNKVRRSSPKTWPFEEACDDVLIVEEENTFGETICEDKAKSEKRRAKFLKFHENRRPAYYGTWRKKSKFVKARKPFAEDKDTFDYEVDSDDDWEEEEQGESLNGSDDEEKEPEAENDDYEVDNEFFVPHGHLSDDEVDDEANARLSPESMKQKLKLLKDEFDEDMKSKTQKIKPRSIGCIWYNKEGNNVDEAIDRYLQPLAVITNRQIVIKKRSELFTLNSARKKTPLQELNPELMAAFLKLIHGNNKKKKEIVAQFITFMANNGFSVDIPKSHLGKHLTQLAKWKKCPEEGPMRNKLCWYVDEDVRKKYNLQLSLPNTFESD